MHFYRPIVGIAEVADHTLLQDIPVFWDAANFTALAELGARGFVTDRDALVR